MQLTSKISRQSSFVKCLIITYDNLIFLFHFTTSLHRSCVCSLLFYIVQIMASLDPSTLLYEQKEIFVPTLEELCPSKIDFTKKVIQSVVLSFSPSSSREWTQVKLQRSYVSNCRLSRLNSGPISPCCIGSRWRSYDCWVRWSTLSAA